MLKSLCLLALRLTDHHRNSKITAFANAHRNRYRAEEGNLIPFRQRLSTAIAEDMIAFTVSTLEIAHIFDNAENRHVKLLKHTIGLPDIAQRDLLRCRHQHCSGDGDHLRETQLHIACPGGHVDYQVVELSPLNLAQKL